MSQATRKAAKKKRMALKEANDALVRLNEELVSARVDSHNFKQAIVKLAKMGLAEVESLKGDLPNNSLEQILNGIVAAGEVTIS